MERGAVLVDRSAANELRRIHAVTARGLAAEVVLLDAAPTPDLPGTVGVGGDAEHAVFVTGDERRQPRPSAAASCQPTNYGRTGLLDGCQW